MAILDTRVNPGDLIKADLMNHLLDSLASLEERVAALEQSSSSGTSAVAITALIPSGPIRELEEMQIQGRNFGFSIGAHRVFVDGTRVMSFKAGSSNEKLIFDMPDLPGVTGEEGKAVILSVSNQTTTDVRTIVVLPLQIPLTGNLDLNFESVTPGTAVAGSPITFRYRLRSRANKAAQFSISASVTGVANPAAWNNQLQVLDDNDNPLQTKLITLEPEQEKFFRVRIPAIPAVAAGSNFSMNVSATAPGVTATPDARVLTMGQPAEQMDAAVRLSFQSAMPTTAVSGGTIQLAAGSTAKITLKAEFDVPEVAHTITANVLSGASWTASRSAITTPQSITVTQAELAAAAPNTFVTKTLDFIVQAQAGASTTGEVEFRIQRQNATSPRTKKFTLQRV